MLLLFLLTQISKEITKSHDLKTHNLTLSKELEDGRERYERLAGMKTALENAMETKQVSYPTINRR